jgi:hypothetical protein
VNPLWLYVAAHAGWVAHACKVWLVRERRAGRSVVDVFRPNGGKSKAPRVPSVTEVP